MADEDDSTPAWWRENQQLRDEMELPSYRPPRFSDDEPTYRIVRALETKYDCHVRFVGVNTRYLDDWEVRVDGEAVATIGRHRDGEGNTVYEMDSAEFRATVVDHFEGAASASG